MTATELHEAEDFHVEECEACAIEHARVADVILTAKCGGFFLHHQAGTA